ncbi:MAG: alpha/beta hydrolase [Ktedonobacteraceae bacterium]
MTQREGFISVEDGLRLYYQVIGNGPDSIICPAASWLAADLEPLAQGRTLIFYDQRSRGQSDAVTDTSKIGMRYEVEDLEAVRRHFGLETVSLIGWSYLGGVTALYAMEHAERVRRLLMIGPISPRRIKYDDPRDFDPDDRLDPVGVKHIEEMRAAGLDKSDPIAYSREYYRVTLPRQMGNPAAVARMRSEPWNYPNERPDAVFKLFGSLFGAIEKRDWRPGAASIKASTLVVHGIDDLVPLASSREWAAVIPDSRLFTIAGAGHYPWLEAPEIFFPAVEQFLAGRWPEGAEKVHKINH